MTPVKESFLLSPAPNDGVILVAAARLPGMKDFVVLPHTHTLIMNASDTFEHCRRFLEAGRFRSSGTAPAKFAPGTDGGGFSGL